MKPVENTPPRHGLPLRAIVLFGWVLAYLLLMFLANWPWQAESFWNYGSPSAGVLERAGALVPARAAWTSFLLSPWLHRSLLGLLLYMLFFGGSARQVLAFAGAVRTWILFVLGGAAGAAGHLLAHPDSVMPVGAGPFDAIAALIGASLAWGLFSGAPGAKAARNSALVTIVIVAAFTAYGTRESGGHPDVWTLIGLEAMLAAFGAGFLALLALGPRRCARPASGAVRTLAASLAVAVLAAAGVQGAALLGTADRTKAGALLAKLESAEQIAYELSRDQADAEESKRGALGRALERVLQDEFLSGYDGEPALRAYIEALRAYQRPVRLPWVAEGACRKAFDAWFADFERPLRDSRGLAPRHALRFYWRPS